MGQGAKNVGLDRGREYLLENIMIRIDLYLCISFRQFESLSASRVILYSKVILVVILFQLQTCVQFDNCHPLSSGQDRNGQGAPHPPSHPVQLPLPSLPPAKPPHRIFGMRGSDIDKYSRVIFPIMFLSFHMMYWMIYLSISGDIPEDLVYLE